MRNVLRYLGLAALLPISSGWCLQYGDLQTTRLEYPGRTSVSGQNTAYIRATGPGELGALYFLLGCDDSTVLTSPYTGGYMKIINTLSGVRRISGTIQGVTYPSNVGGAGGTYYVETVNHNGSYYKVPIPASTAINSPNEFSMALIHYGTYTQCTKTSIWAGWDSKPASTTIEYPYNSGVRYGNGSTGSYYIRVGTYAGQQQHTELLYYSYIHLEPGDRALLLRQRDQTQKISYSYIVSPELVGHIQINDESELAVNGSGSFAMGSQSLYIENVSNSKGRIEGNVSITVQIT